MDDELGIFKFRWGVLHNFLHWKLKKFNCDLLGINFSAGNNIRGGKSCLFCWVFPIVRISYFIEITRNDNMD
jgi:hypothetical protein